MTPYVGLSTGALGPHLMESQMTKDGQTELQHLQEEYCTLQEEIRQRHLPSDAHDPAAIFRFIAQEQTQHSVTLLCRTLGVSPSGYWAWRNRGPSLRDRRDQELLTSIRAIHAASGGRYGAPRIQASLQAEGIACSRKRVARLMRTHGLVGSSAAHRVVL